LSEPTPRVVLVTGGNRGIGLACARAFADDGHRVAVTYRSDPPPAAEATGILAVKCDVTDVAQVDAAFAQIEEALGPVEVLVSNAGMTADMLVLRMGEDDFTSVLDANLVGGFRVAKRAVQKMMRARWGRVIFLGSVVGSTGQAGQANYAASKAGVIAMTRTIAKELAGRKITINAVAPGFIETEMTDALGPLVIEEVKKRIPAKRLGQADEIAYGVLFLASEAAGYINGQVLTIDGGLCA
jgi:NAD(P)-dependent dehydrogenase (short-subunit alcohol dehydrogenase family)